MLFWAEHQVIYKCVHIFPTSINSEGIGGHCAEGAFQGRTPHVERSVVSRNNSCNPKRGSMEIPIKYLQIFHKRPVCLRSHWYTCNITCCSSCSCYQVYMYKLSRYKRQSLFMTFSRGCWSFLLLLCLRVTLCTVYAISLNIKVKILLTSTMAAVQRVALLWASMHM